MADFFLCIMGGGAELVAALDVLPSSHVLGEED